MKTILLAAVILSTAAAAHSACLGSGSLRTCTDDSGNSYTINKLGNSTYVQGSNAQTGSTWSQETHRSGSTSNTYGRDSDGNSWNSNTYRSGSSTNTYGTDSNGRSFQRTCNQYGCY